MEKKTDQWSVIAKLIQMDKQAVLDDFRRSEFIPTALTLRPRPKPVLRSMFMAAAASLLLTAGLIAFWLLQGIRQKVPAASGLDNLLADSFLYKSGREPEKKAPEFHDISIFSSALSVWGSEAGFNLAASPAAKPIDMSGVVEHGDPAVVHRKMKKIIGENAIERLLAEFCQIGKEA